MPPRPPDLEVVLAAVRRTRDNPESDEAVGVLRGALADPRSLVVAPAAEVVADNHLATLDRELAAAFTAWLARPPDADRGCRAKTRLAWALLQVDHAESATFRAAIHHRQVEKGFPPVDTAAELRGKAVAGIVQCGDHDAALIVAEALADEWAAAREGAARAAAGLMPLAAVPMLRLKVGVGDDDVSVIGACFASLAELDIRVAIDVASTMLEQPAPLVEAILVELGSSRRRESLPVLQRAAELPAVRRTAMIAAAILRDDAATAWLLQEIEAGDSPADAIRALAPFRHDPRIADAVRTRARRRGDARILALVERELA